MATTQAGSLGNILLFFGSFKSEDNSAVDTSTFCEIGDNRHYVYKPPPPPPRNSVESSPAWLGDPPEQGISAPVFCLALDNPPDNQDGWVFGSSPDKQGCHFRLAENNQGGISRRCFSIDVFSRPGYETVAKLKLLSGKLRVSSKSGKDSLLITKGDTRELSEPCTIRCGRLSFRTWSPRLAPKERALFAKNVKAFHKRALDCVPMYFPPITSEPVTRENDDRIGQEGAVYVRLDMVDYDGGSSGSVFKVSQKDTERVFCAKELHWKKSDHPGTIRYQAEKLEKEYGRMKELSHPHIVEAIDFARGWDPIQRPWLIMEFIPYTLQHFYIDQSLDIRLPVITAQILTALVHIHEHGIRHGDLKPENILMSRTENHWAAKLADFGEAEDLMHSVVFAGTAWFIAPEMLEIPRQCDEKADMFSLGMILVMLLTGSRVWSERTSDYTKQFPWASELQQRFMCEAVLPLVKDLGRDLVPLLKGLLCQEPESRWSSEKALAWVLDYIDKTGGQETNTQQGNDRKRKREHYATQILSAASDVSTIRLPTSPETDGSQVHRQPPSLHKDRDADESSSGTFLTAKENPSEVVSLTDLVPGYDLDHGAQLSMIARMMEVIADPHVLGHEVFAFAHLPSPGIPQSVHGSIPRVPATNSLIHQQMPNNVLSQDTNRNLRGNRPVLRSEKSPEDSLPDTLSWDNRISTESGTRLRPHTPNLQDPVTTSDDPLPNSTLPGGTAPEIRLHPFTDDPSHNLRSYRAPASPTSVATPFTQDDDDTYENGVNSDREENAERAS